MNRYVEFHLGRTISLSSLSELLTEISIQRFQGFVRVTEVGEGRFVLSFGGSATPGPTLLTLIRENPSQLYAERNAGHLGDWVLDVLSSEICQRTGALVSTQDQQGLHAAPRAVFPSFADWLLAERAEHAEELFAAYSPSVPLPLRGLVAFRGRPGI